MGQLAYVDLLGELSSYGTLDVLDGTEPATGECPPAYLGFAGALPEQDLQ